MKTEKKNILKAYEAADEKGKETLRLTWPDAFPKEERTYRRGDVFETIHFKGCRFMLCEHDNAMVLMEVESDSSTATPGKPFSNKSIVCDGSRRITQADFKHLIGSCAIEDFTLIQK